MLKIQNEKLKNAIITCISYHSFFSEILLSANIIESKNIKTAAVNFTEKGINLYYNKEFFDSLTQPEVNFIIFHEVYHVLSNHGDRAIFKGYNHKTANIAADMIINTDIKNNYCNSLYINYIQVPSVKDENGVSVEKGWTVPEEYKGPHIMEPLYEWLIEHNYIKNSNNYTLGDGNSPIDEHILDTIPKEMKDDIVKDLIERAKSRGNINSTMEETLKRLRPNTKNYIRIIKTAIDVLGSSKKSWTWQRMSKKDDVHKGYKKQKKAFNLILDVSGSMHGSIERGLSYIFKSGYEVNMFQVDTEVQCNYKIKTKNQLQRMTIKGCGGTILQPAIDMVVEKSNNLSTIIITDGYTDTLDVSKLHNHVLVLSVERECPIYGKSKVKQIIVEK